MDPLIGLSLGRIAVGATALSSPELTAKLFQLDGAANRQLPLMTRMFGSREIALGVITLAARGRARRRLALTGIGVDAADVAATVAAVRDGSLPTRAWVVIGIPAGLATLTGVSVLTGRKPGPAPVSEETAQRGVGNAL